MVDGERRWFEYESLETGGDDFADLGQAFESAYAIAVNHIAQAEVRFLKQRDLVDFGVAWIEKHRQLAA